MDKQDIINNSISELKDIAYSLKTNQIIQELESKHLKKSVDDLKLLLEKEIDKREKKDQEAKNNQSSVKVALITGCLGFLTALVVAVIGLLK